MYFYVSETLEGLSSDSALFFHRPGPQTSDQPEVFTRSTPLSGRYVKVQRYQETGGYMCFTEIEVYTGES